jgi:hypothetical protein
VSDVRYVLQMIADFSIMIFIMGIMIVRPLRGDGWIVVDASIYFVRFAKKKENDESKISKR